MTTVSDIMTREVFCLDEDAPVSSASWEMNAEFVSGAPVRNRNGRVVGILSKTDVLKRDSSPPLKVKDVMNPRVAAVAPEAPIRDVVRMMLDQSIHRVLVCDPVGKLVGIVTPLDVLKQLDEAGTFSD